MCNNLILLGTPDDVFAEFYNNSRAHGRYTVSIRGARCKTYDAFLKEYSAAFQFPSYFGENWNAWYECAWDLYWLSFTSLAIIIDDYDFLFINESDSKDAKSLFIKDMSDLQKYWQEEKGVTCKLSIFSMQKLNEK